MTEITTNRVEVKLMVYVKGQLSPRGDVRELEPVVAAVINGAGQSLRKWANENLSADEPCGWDYSVQLTSTAPKPKQPRKRR